MRWRVLRRYPIPFLAIGGLGAGAVINYIFHGPQVAASIWLGTLVVGGTPLVFQTIQKLSRREFSADVIAMLAIIAAIVLDQAFAGVIIVLMQSGGQSIENFAFHRASSSLEGLLNRVPKLALRQGPRGLEEIPVDRVSPGDVLLLRSGDLVPVDGDVLDESALLDESAVTGEPLPRRRSTSETVLSGSVNVGPPFLLRALRKAQESQYARMVALVEAAQQKKPRIQRLADRYAVWFTPLTVGVALFGWLWTHSPLTALAVLVVATPCPLILATPIAVIGAINRASDEGIVVKSGAAIEEVGRASAVVFDKTGTLTHGRPEIEGIVSFGGIAPDVLLRLAGSLEQASSHPIGQMLSREAKLRLGTLPTPLEIHELAGRGIEGQVEGYRVVVGSSTMCASRIGRSLDPEAAALRAKTPTEGRLVSFVLVDSVPAGAVLFADRLRPGVPEMVRRLESLGVVHLAILTGDEPRNAVEIARQSGISAVEAELLPEQKVQYVRSVREKLGSVVMVGDGINDAPALAMASVGVAMGARGTAISAEAADVVLLVDDVSRVADAVEIGRTMLSVAQQGILFGLGASGVLMGIAAFGAIPPAIGAILQEGIDVAVIVNALRAR